MVPLPGMALPARSTLCLEGGMPVIISTISDSFDTGSESSTCAWLLVGSGTDVIQLAQWILVQARAFGNVEYLDREDAVVISCNGYRYFAHGAGAWSCAAVATILTGLLMSSSRSRDTFNRTGQPDRQGIHSTYDNVNSLRWFRRTQISWLENGYLMFKWTVSTLQRHSCILKPA